MPFMLAGASRINMNKINTIEQCRGDVVTELKVNYMHDRAKHRATNTAKKAGALSVTPNQKRYIANEKVNNPKRGTKNTKTKYIVKKTNETD
jgi:hypothetical protein